MIKCFIFMLILSVIICGQGKSPQFLADEQLQNGEHHTNHFEAFSSVVPEYNKYVLKAIDIVQSTAPDGGGYFTGIKAIPPEAPIGYDIKLFGAELINLERTTSYCSGATYSAFIEALNLIFPNGNTRLSSDRYESLRMQEIDGSRREDHIKFWGKWNADGYGNDFALRQYSGCGERISPREGLPGDFMNIQWKKGLGHSVIFLGWQVAEDGLLNLVYWSSQKGTNGLGDAIVPVSSIKECVFIRLTNPENIFNFNVNNDVDTDVKGDLIIFGDDKNVL